jgi:hypothetical protein
MKSLPSSVRFLGGKVSISSFFTYPANGGFMNLDRILSEIDLEISRLQQAKQLLSENSSSGSVVKRGPGRPPAAVKAVTKHTMSAPIEPKRRTMSAAGRARIAAAQKARWAKTKRAAKKATAPASRKTAAKKTGKRLGRPPLKKSAVTETPSTSAA